MMLFKVLLLVSLFFSQVISANFFLACSKEKKCYYDDTKKSQENAWKNDSCILKDAEIEPLTKIQENNYLGKRGLCSINLNEGMVERRGCCSWHLGVCGCSEGRAFCCDGNLSPSCGCD